MNFIPQACVNLRPGAGVSIDGNVIHWHGITDIPSDAEIQAEAARLQSEYNAKNYQRQRAAAYPPMADYLDGIVKNDQAQIARYIADCLAVKAKYPKT